MTEHPITPPPELVQQWMLEAHHKDAPPGTCPDTRVLIARAAQWGADQKLKACCEWAQGYAECGDSLRAARRPKPPSLAEQAAHHLDEAVMRGDCITTTDAMPYLRQALQRLAELEQQASS